MKKITSILLVSSLFIQNVFAAPTSLNKAPTSSVANIKVGGKSLSVSLAELNDLLKAYKTYGIEVSEKEALEGLINQKVVELSAQRDKIVVTDNQIESQIAQAKSQMEQQVGKEISDEDFAQLIQVQTGSTMEEYKKSLKTQAILAQYMQKKKPNEANKTFDVSVDEIKQFYRRNASQFVLPEMVRVAHVFKEKKNNPKEDNESLKTLEKALKDIKSNKLSFEKAVSEYSEDDDSKGRGGDIGWVAGNSQGTVGLMGEPFIDAVLDLNAGDISKTVIESKVGYHIVKCVVHETQKFLNLNDKITPESQITVSEYIKQGLVSQKQQEHVVKVLNEILEDLKKDAQITISKR